MNYTIEQRPQSQPGSCCLTGIHEDEWFIRLHTADAFTGSLIISKTAFDQLAREQGYVPANHTDQKIREIKELQDALAPILADIDARTRIATAPLVALSDAIQGIQTLARAIERFDPPVSIIDGGFDEVEHGASDSAEGSSEPVAESQLDGIFPVGGKRTPGLPRTAGKN